MQIALQHFLHYYLQNIIALLKGALKIVLHNVLIRLQNLIKILR